MKKKTNHDAVTTAELTSDGKGEIWHHFIVLSFFGAILFVLLTTPNNFGLVADYFLFVPFLSATRLYLLKNGLFAIPYYSPALGAGLPLYADPESPIFSVSQLVFNYSPEPYFGIKFAFVLSSVLAYFGCYSFLRYFRIRYWIASAGSVVFALNGYIVSSWLVGHFSKVNYWEIPWILLCLAKIYQEQSKKTVLASALWASVLLSQYVYGADINSIYLTVILCFTFLLSLRFCLGKPGSGLFRWFASFAIPPLSAALASSKLLAIMDYLKHFPRLTENNVMKPIEILWAIPNALFNPTLTISSHIPFNLGGWHEYCSYSGVSLLVCLVLALVWAFRSRTTAAPPEHDRLLRFFTWWAGITIFFVGYLMLGNNALWVVLKKLPVVSSFHMISRFMGAFPITLIGLSVTFLDRLWSVEKKRFVPILFSLLFVVDVTWYFANDDYSIHRPWPPVQFPEHLSDFKIEHWYPGIGVQYLHQKIGDSYQLPPQFGYVGDNRLRRQVVDPQFPPLHQFPDGTYNVSDPVAMIYPDEIGRPPWSRLPVAGNEEKVKKFLAFEDPGFYVPTRQKRANLISLLAYLFCIFVLLEIRFNKITGLFSKPREIP